MFGGIPEYEIDELMPFWNAFPGMKEDIFGAVSPGYFEKKQGESNVLRSGKENGEGQEAVSKDRT